MSGNGGWPGISAAKRSDVILSQFRSLLMALQVPASEARAKVEPWIVNATAFANKVGTSYGYSVLNGEEIPDELIKVIHLRKGNMKSYWQATDIRC